jgi:hypothetical protein
MTRLESGPQPCPFCGGTYQLRGTPDLDGFHTRPTCKEWDEMDLMEFTIKARQARGIPLPGES